MQFAAKSEQRRIANCGGLVFLSNFRLEYDNAVLVHDADGPARMR
jgi:hypothetical protein